jgi:hypothetical protein
MKRPGPPLSDRGAFVSVPRPSEAGNVVNIRRPRRNFKPCARRRITAVENSLAHQVAARVGGQRAAGRDWATVLIDIDRSWPDLTFRVCLLGLFLAELEFEHGRRQ